MANSPRPPSDLRTSGAEFWRKVHKSYLLDDRDTPVLHETCRVLDEIDALTAVVAAQGVMSVGSMGQPVEHPALAGLRAHRATLDKLLVRLALPDEAGLTPASSSSQRAQKAAQARWSGHRNREEFWHHRPGAS